MGERKGGSKRRERERDRERISCNPAITLVFVVTKGNKSLLAERQSLEVQMPPAIQKLTHARNKECLGA